MAKFKILDIISLRPEGKEIEDGHIVSDCFLCVLDGATPVKNIKFMGYSNLACWFVDKLKNNLILANSNGFIKKLQCSLEQIIYSHPLQNIPDNDKPTLTISAANIDGEELQLYSLGDCSVFVKRKNGDINRLYDKRVERYSDKTFEQYIEAIKSKEDLDSTIAKTKLQNIKFRNKPNGFWVVNYDNNFYQEMLNSNEIVSEIDMILLCSDGFSRLIDKHKLINIEDVFSGSISLLQAYSILRKYENENYTRDDFGYVKKHDDVTSILAAIIHT